MNIANIILGYALIFAGLAHFALGEHLAGVMLVYAGILILLVMAKDRIDNDIEKNQKVLDECERMLEND